MGHPSDLKKEFFDAIKRGNLEQIESCLRGGANPNLRITDAIYGPTTPLIFAAENGYTAIVELLLAYHADVNFISCYFYTPLMRAAIKGHIEITKLLLDHHAHVNTGSFNHKTALHYAVEKNHTEIVDLLLDHDADTFIINASDSSLLALAAKHGLSASVNLLLKHGGDWEVKRALQLATEFGHFYTVEIILNHIIHILDKTDIETCLMWDNYILYSLNTMVPHRGTYTV